MRTRATKAEAKVLEKLQRSAAAVHLYEGVVYKRNYGVHEAAKYWRTYKNEPWEMGQVPVFGSDMDLGKLEELLVEHDRNIKTLEDMLAEYLPRNPECDVCDGKDSYCTCPCHKTPKDRIAEAIALFPPTFGLSTFPGKLFRMSVPHSYVTETGLLQLYSEVKNGDEWQSFSKGTVEEFKKIVTKPFDFSRPIIDWVPIKVEVPK